VNVYLHVLDGRLRIKVPEVKGAPLKASKVMGALSKIRGVTYVQANPTTGSVLVLFESEVISPEQIVQALRQTGCLLNTGIVSTQGGKPEGVGQRLAETLLHSVFEAAIQRAILSLI
jgi:copper chaperone CopZ